MTSYEPVCAPGRMRDQLKLVPPMASASLKAECGHTLGGVLWWFVDPLLSILVFYVAFSFILRSGGNEFVAFLSIGILVWKWFQGSVLRGAGAILDAAPVLHKVYLHKAALVGTGLLVDAFKFLITLLPLFLLLVLLGFPPGVGWLYLPLVMLTQGVLIAAVAGICAGVTPFMPDLRLVLQHVLQLLLFVSGVFFDIKHIAPSLRPLIRLNPMSGLLQAYRDCLLHRTPPDFGYLGVVAVAGLLGVALGVALIHRYDREYPKIC